MKGESLSPQGDGINSDRKNPRGRTSYDQVSSLTILCSAVECFHEKGIILFHSGNSCARVLSQALMIATGAPAEISSSTKLKE